MLWISIGIELVAAGFLLGAYIRHKVRKDEIEGEDNESRFVQLLLPAGRCLARRIPVSKNKEKSTVYQMISRLTNEESWEKAYFAYRCKRWGLIAGMALLCNSFWIGQQVLQRSQEKELSAVQARPAYGEGDEKKEVTLVMVGQKEQTENTFSIQIPEQKISEAEAAEMLQKGMAYIQQRLQDQLVYEDVSLPTGWQRVSFFYESLTPELIKSDGRWMGSVEKERQEAVLRVTGSLGGQREQADVSLWIPAMQELPAEERLAILTREVQSGRYTTDQAVELPTETSLGEPLYWFQSEGTNPMAWFLLMLLFGGLVLWQQDLEYRHQVKEQQYQIRHAYPEFINELVILIGAGLSLPAAWKRLGQDYQKQKEQKTAAANPLYEEIYREGRELEGGASMREILQEFTAQVRIKEARRFAVLMTQNLKRGDAFLVTRLRELNQEAWELRKKQVREKSEEVDTKLLLPLMLMLVVILIIVLAPAMISMQV